MVEWVHPGLLLIFGSLAVPLLRGTARRAWLLALAAATLVTCLLMSPGTHGVVTFLGHTLTFGRVDRLSLVFSYVFGIMTLIGVVYSLHVREGWQQAAALVYAGSALGAVLAGDLIVLVIFWELLAFSSVFLVWYGGRRDSLAAGFRYLLVHIVGGVSLMAGVVLHVQSTGSIAFDPLGATGGWPSFLILAGIILNAAVPPLSAWLTDAYPEASVTGAVFMSAFTTKTAVYALLRAFPGTEALVWLGAVMALYGVVYAVLQDDARRLLAYHIVSQVGYMVAGVGMGTALSQNGSCAHAFAHIIYKALLFMGAGAVLHVTGKRRLSEMGGLYRTMPITFWLYMVGALSISAMPFTSGFVSKSMIVAGASESGRTLVFLMLSAASAGTFLSVGLKLPYFMFFGPGQAPPAHEPPRNMLAGMGIAAFLCLFVGFFPGSLYRVLPLPVEFVPYTAQHLVSTVEILLLTALGFFILRRVLTPKPSVVLDTDWFYRKGAAALMRLVNGPLASLETRAVAGAHLRLTGALLRLAPAVLAADRLVIEGSVTGVARGAELGGMVLKKFQNGRWQRQFMVMTVGILALLCFLLLRS